MGRIIIVEFPVLILVNFCPENAMNLKEIFKNQSWWKVKKSLSNQTQGDWNCLISSIYYLDWFPKYACCIVWKAKFSVLYLFKYLNNFMLLISSIQITLCDEIKNPLSILWLNLQTSIVCILVLDLIIFKFSNVQLANKNLDATEWSAYFKI